MDYAADKDETTVASIQTDRQTDYAEHKRHREIRQAAAQTSGQSAHDEARPFYLFFLVVGLRQKYLVPPPAVRLARTLLTNGSSASTRSRLLSFSGT